MIAARAAARARRIVLLINPRIDGSPLGLVVRVAVDVATDSLSAVAFCVCPERVDGTAFEVLTDASVQTVATPRIRSSRGSSSRILATGR